MAVNISAKERQRLEARAAKLRPRPHMLPSGAWNCQVMVDGVRYSVTEDTPEDAHTVALAMKKKLVRRENQQIKFLALEDAIDAYILRKGNVLSPSTVRGYDGVKRNRFKNLMGRNVYELTKADVQAAVSEESKTVSPKTVYNAYGLIRPVLKEYGVDVFGVKLPQRLKPKKRYLQPDDVAALMEAARGDPCEIEILIAVWLGLRRSEIIGLCWDCVDFDRGTITVRRTVVPDKNHKLVLKTGAKNEMSQRTIPCPKQIMDMLEEKRTPGSTGRIFKIHPDTLRKHIHRCCAKAGITDTTVHGLRHTNAAVMKQLGIPDAYAMQRGGWSNEATYKQVYSYVFDQAAADADTAIDSYFQTIANGAKNEGTIADELQTVNFGTAHE